MNIGDVVRFAELPANTIRYCKDISLVISARDDNRYRRFYVYDLHKLVFFGRALSLGFTIEDCRTLLALYECKDRANADVRKIAQYHLDYIDAKIME